MHDHAASVRRLVRDTIEVPLAGLFLDATHPVQLEAPEGPSLARSASEAFLCRLLHMLRHTFCSHLAMRGAPARAIQELAGHMDLTTTQRYMHLSPSAVDNAIRLLEVENPGVENKRHGGRWPI